MLKKTKKVKLKEKIAIIGEGYTEWYYFNGMKRIETFNFDIKPELPKHSDINSVYRKAKELIKIGYNKVFCVIDYDNIIKTQKTLIKFAKYKTKISNIIFIESMPCFEYWFLLHFLTNYSSRVYVNCNQVECDLKKYLTYKKSKKYFEKNNIYKLLKSNKKMEKALNFSCQSIVEKAKSNNKLYPYTKMYNLFEKLNILTL